VPALLHTPGLKPRVISERLLSPETEGKDVIALLNSN
jgi:hypothetical protein